MNIPAEAMVQEYIDGSLDPSGAGRLAAILEADSAAVAEFADQLQIHGRLAAVLGPSASLAGPVVREIMLIPDSSRFSRELVERIKREERRASRLRIWSVAAACAAFAVVLMFLMRPEPGGSGSPAGAGVLFLVGGRPPAGGDAFVRGRLERLGFSVAVETVDWFNPSRLRGKAAVLVSSTTYALEAISAPDRPTRELRDAEVPLMVWEPLLYHELGMIPGGVHKADWAAGRGLSHVVIADPAHPLAAGFSGRVKVAASPSQLSWGRPRPDAARVAVIEDAPERAAIFAYERGAAMPRGRAPARRLGFFLFDDTADALTEEGWRLFDAAVRWCAGDVSR